MNAPADPIAAQLLTLRAPAPFELRVVAFGHGWIDLPPYRWDDARNAIVTVLDVGTASAPLPADVVVTAPRGQVVRAELRAARSLSARHVARAERTLHSMLRLEQDLAPFYAQCTAYPRLRWACVRGAGRLLRGATVFEDLLKLLFTTNCSWAATRKMTERTVALLGTPAPSGGRAFPSAAQCAEANASFWRDEVRAGYRDTACAGLAESFASGKLSEAWFTDPDVPTEELRRRLLTIRGFGPYAAGQALRLLGHYDDLALDAWCRARFAELAGKKKPPSDKTIARGYRGFGRYAGLALWLDLTRAWHEPAGDRSPLLA